MVSIIWPAPPPTLLLEEEEDEVVVDDEEQDFCRLDVGGFSIPSSGRRWRLLVNRLPTMVVTHWAKSTRSSSLSRGVAMSFWRITSRILPKGGSSTTPVIGLVLPPLPDLLLVPLLLPPLLLSWLDQEGEEDLELVEPRLLLVVLLGSWEAGAAPFSPEVEVEGTVAVAVPPPPPPEVEDSSFIQQTFAQ